MLGNHCFRLFQEANQYLRQNPDMAMTVEFQDYEAFKCSCCAQCCTIPWQVVVSKAYYERWQYYLEAHPSGCFQSAFVVHQPQNLPAYAYLRKQSDNQRCVLLTDDNLCIMHQEFGPTAKPEGCQRYPKADMDTGGLLQGRHTMPSCNSIPLLWEQEAELIYHYVPRTMLSWAKPSPLILLPAVRMDIWGLNLWMGLMLDNLLRPGLPAQHLVAMNYVLLHLSEWSHPVVYETDIKHLQSRFHRFLESPSGRQVTCSEHPIDWQWLLGLQLYPPMNDYYAHPDTRVLPLLSTAEHELLQQFLRNYLLRKSIFYPFWTTGQLTLFQEHYVWAIWVICLQLLALYFRQTNPRQTLDMDGLRRAVNLVEARLAQSTTWLNAHQIPQMSAMECLQQIAILLSWKIYVL